MRGGLVILVFLGLRGYLGCGIFRVKVERVLGWFVIDVLRIRYKLDWLVGLFLV